jgi:predicted nucleotidyltransferase
MATLERIQEFCDRLVAEFHPEKIILFGSHAAGTARIDSDVDLLVILPFKGKGMRQAAEIRNRIRASFPLDLIVRTPEQMRRRLSLNDFFLREVVEKGKVLYEAPHARVA